MNRHGKEEHIIQDLSYKQWSTLALSKYYYFDTDIDIGEKKQFQAFELHSNSIVSEYKQAFELCVCVCVCKTMLFDVTGVWTVCKCVRARPQQ